MLLMFISRIGGAACQAQPVNWVEIGRSDGRRRGRICGMKRDHAKGSREKRASPNGSSRFGIPEQPRRFFDPRIAPGASTNGGVCRHTSFFLPLEQICRETKGNDEGHGSEQT